MDHRKFSLENLKCTQIFSIAMAYRWYKGRHLYGPTRGNMVSLGLLFGNKSKSVTCHIVIWGPHLESYNTIYLCLAQEQGAMGHVLIRGPPLKS